MKKINPLSVVRQVIRGEHINAKMWRITFIALIISFAMVYSSGSMDQKVYRLKKLKEEKNSLTTEYVELQSRISQVRMESGLLSEFQARGFVTSTEPKYQITVKK